MLSLFAFAVWTVDALLKFTAPSDVQIRPDGKEFAFVYKGQIQAARTDAADTARALTPGSRPRWSPDGKKLAYLSTQVFIFDPLTGSKKQLTSSPSPVTFFAWSPQGNAIAYMSADPGPEPDPVIADRDFKFARIYWQLLDGGAPRLLTKSNRHVLSFSISPDSRHIVFAGQSTPRNRDVFDVDLFDVDTGTAQEKPLVVQPGRDAEPSYSPDGRFIAFHSQAGSTNYFEARHVGIVPAAGGTTRYLTEGRNYDVFRNGSVFSWSPDSRSVAFTAGKGVHDFLVREDVPNGKSEVLLADISGPASFTPEATRAVFLKTNTQHPSEIFLWDRGKETQLTHLQKNVSDFPSMRSEVIRWKSKDGTEIEGVLWLPTDYTRGKRLPLLTELHGGPTGATIDAWPTPRVYPTQLFVQNGIAVFSPNFRGSANYGAPFRLKNSQSQGVGDYEDVMTGVDHLIAMGIADPDRLGVMGWSYGGFLTGSVITQTNRFRAASVGAPATDWFTYYGQMDSAPSVLWTYFGGTPWDAPEKYARYSSRSKLRDIRTPALLQVGSLDINHNTEIYKALLDHNVPVEYVVYPREGHGFVEPAHIRDAMERNYRWFMRWLMPDAPL